MGVWRRRSGTKYGNRPKRCQQGAIHHSTLEADQCDVLHILEKSGKICGLVAHPQPRYDLKVNGEHVCTIIPDFEFTWTETGELVTQDTKGFQSEVSKFKCALFRALFGREIELVRRPWGPNR